MVFRAEKSFALLPQDWLVDCDDEAADGVEADDDCFGNGPLVESYSMFG